MAPKKGKRSLPPPDPLPVPRRGTAAMPAPAAPSRQPSLRQTSLDAHVRVLVRHDRDMTDSEPDIPDDDEKKVPPRAVSPPRKRQKRASPAPPPPAVARGRSKRQAGKKAPSVRQPGSPTPGPSGVIAPRRRSPRVLARVLPKPSPESSSSSSSSEEDCGSDWDPTREEQPHKGDLLFSGKFTLH